MLLTDLLGRALRESSAACQRIHGTPPTPADWISSSESAYSVLEDDSTFSTSLIFTAGVFLSLPASRLAFLPNRIDIRVYPTGNGGVVEGFADLRELQLLASARRAQGAVQLARPHQQSVQDASVKEINCERAVAATLDQVRGGHSVPALVPPDAVGLLDGIIAGGGAAGWELSTA